VEIKGKNTTKDFIELSIVIWNTNSLIKIFFGYFRKQHEICRSYSTYQVNFYLDNVYFNSLSVLNKYKKGNIFDFFKTIYFSCIYLSQRTSFFNINVRKKLIFTNIDIGVNYLISPLNNVLFASKNGNQTSNKIYKP
jgi:hypothetical protein